MYCKKCGKEVNENARFCKNCGAELKTNVKPEKKRKNPVLLIIAIVLGVVVIGLFGILAMIFILGKGSEPALIVETTTAEETTIEMDTTEDIYTEEITEELINSEDVADIDFESTIQTIRDNYYEIQNNLSEYSQDGVEGLYSRWYDNGVLRKIVLQPSEAEFRELTNEYYYDENGMFQFAFLYDSDGNEYRYYFYEGKLYRYIDASGKITDYENGENHYITDDIATIYSNAEREKMF